MGLNGYYSLMELYQIVWTVRKAIFVPPVDVRNKIIISIERTM